MTPASAGNEHHHTGRCCNLQELPPARSYFGPNLTSQTPPRRRYGHLAKLSKADLHECKSAPLSLNDQVRILENHLASVPELISDFDFQHMRAISIHRRIQTEVGIAEITVFQCVRQQRQQ